MIEIIPAIDIIDGKCVRLTQGDYAQKKNYSDHPLEVAKKFEDLGIKRLHLVDLDGAKSSHVVNLNVLEQIATNTSLTVDFGGGIKSEYDLRQCFDAGAKLVTVGSVSATNPEMVACWMTEFGIERFIIGADVKNEKICINGWKDEAKYDIYTFINKYVSLGCKQILCTDISKDGMLQGPSTTLYSSIVQRYPNVHLIASGGVGTIDDLRRLNDLGIPSVVFGKAYYEGRIRMEDLREFL